MLHGWGTCGFIFSAINHRELPPAPRLSVQSDFSAASDEWWEDGSASGWRCAAASLEGTGQQRPLDFSGLVLLASSEPPEVTCGGLVLSRWRIRGIAWMSWNHQGVSASWGDGPLFRICPRTLHSSRMWEGRSEPFPALRFSNSFVWDFGPAGLLLPAKVSTGDIWPELNAEASTQTPSPGCHVLPGEAILPRCPLAFWISWWEVPTIQYENYMINMVV